jgi:hypothetical protein
MYRVELKGFSVLGLAGFVLMFLMYRVELKGLCPQKMKNKNKKIKNQSKCKSVKIVSVVL